MQKLSKEQMLSELMVKLETIDGKLDKLLNSDLRIVTNISISGDTNPDSLIEQIKAVWETVFIMKNQLAGLMSHMETI